MRLHRRVQLRVRRLMAPQRSELDLQDELAFHLEQQERLYREQGMPPADARAAARRDFGAEAGIAEACRDTAGTRVWFDLLRDVRFGWRAALRAPGTTGAAVPTLGIGLGAATAMYSVVDGVLLRPLPFPAAERVIRADQYVAAGALAVIADGATTMVQVGMLQPNLDVNLGGDTHPERVRGTAVSDGLLPLLGVRSALGRTIAPADMDAAAPPVVVVSHALWTRRFGARADAIGRTLRVDGVTREIVGVLPSGSLLPLPEADVWLPAVTRGLPPAALWGSSYSVLLARLRPGVTVAAATADLRRLAPLVRDSYPWRMPDEFGAEIAAVPLHESVVGDVRARLVLLGLAVGLLLLSACANVAMLVLSRALTREREFAVRAAIGASRRRLIQQLLTETLVLWGSGGLLSLLLAWLGLDLLRTWLPADIPRLQDLTLDWRAVATGLTATLATGLLFGLLPAWRMSRPDLAPFMKANDGGVATTAGRQLLIRALVVAQLASAVVLVTGSVLLSRSLWNLRQVPPGFDAAGVLTASLTPDRSVCAEPAQCATFYDSVIARASVLPQVAAVGLSHLVPLDGTPGFFAIDVQDHPMAPGAPAFTAVRHVTTPGYFDALDVGTSRGRGLTDSDASSADPVVVVNESFARRFWPGQDPVGKRLRYVWQPTWRTIIGVVHDVRHDGLALPAPLEFYVPYGQEQPREMTLFIRSTAPWTTVAADVRRLVASINPDVPVSKVRPMQALVEGSLAGSASLLSLLTTFGGVVLLLGAIGTYGVLASSVSSRRRELGIRLALGASPRSVSRLVFRDATKLCAVSLLIGAPLA
ncbi:MAG: ADOP family duplicated permease, partial [Luteitalea sp.]